MSASDIYMTGITRNLIIYVFLFVCNFIDSKAIKYIIWYIYIYILWPFFEQIAIQPPGPPGNLTVSSLKWTNEEHQQCILSWTPAYSVVPVRKYKVFISVQVGLHVYHKHHVVPAVSLTPSEFCHLRLVNGVSLKQFYTYNLYLLTQCTISFLTSMSNYDLQPAKSEFSKNCDI